MKKYLFLIPLYFLFPLVSYGAEFVITYNASESAQFWTTTGGGQSEAVYQSFMAPYNGTGTLKYWANVSSGGLDLGATITNPQNSQAQANALMLGSSGSSCGSGNFPNQFVNGENIVGGSITQYEDNIEYTLQAGKYYTLCFTGNLGANQTGNIWGNPNNDYFSGMASSSANIVRDLSLWFTSNNSSTNAGALSFRWPKDDSGTTDFQNWVIDWAFLNATSSGSMTVNYGLSSTTLNLSDTIQFSPFVSAEPLPISKSNPLLDPSDVNSSSTWYAQVTYTGNNGVTVSSEIIGFIASKNTVISPADEDAQLAQTEASNIIFLSASSSIDQDCGLTAIAGCFINAGVYLANFLFRPSTYALNGIKAGIVQFKEIFPFSVYFGVQDAIDDGIANASSTNSISLSVPGFVYANTAVLGTINSSTLVNMMTTAHCNSACASATRDRLFLYVRMTLWILTAGTAIRMITRNAH